MRICIIGVFSGNPDEGFKNIATQISSRLQNDHEILTLDVKDIISINFWNKIRKFKPQILHYITAPTFSSFLVLKFAKIYGNKQAKLVISSIHPNVYRMLKKPFLKKMIPLIKPDLILTQSYKVEKIFRHLGCNTSFLPNGVDTNRFNSVSKQMKKQLREKYGLDKGIFIFLHIGHLKKNRGLKLFSELCKKIPNSQALIIGSSHTKIDKTYCNELINGGCIVWDSYFEHVEEIFQLADCYVFPKGTTVFMPLSIMEAMSCNLPIISYPFDGLSVFKEVDGLMFANNLINYLEGLYNVMNKNIHSKTRDNVLQYSWKNVVERLEHIYNSLIAEEKT